MRGLSPPERRQVIGGGLAVALAPKAARAAGGSMYGMIGKMTVQAAIAKARPMIAGMEASAITEPVGGYGLVKG